MSDAVVDDIVAVLPPLLQSFEALAFVARHLNPPDFDRVLQAVGSPESPLQAARAEFREWPEKFAEVRLSMETASEAVLSAFAGLRAVQHGQGDLVAVLRALRYAARAQEALYPLAQKFPPVNDFFLDPSLRDHGDFKAKLAQPAAQDTGVMHDHNEPGNRGGFSLYVPEYYTPDRDWPLVMAMHGGSGNGRNFLWSWLRDARSFGAILIAPTATGPTWALMGEDTDTANLMRILEAVRSRWNVDSRRMLLTGMSDGGTFCYVSGLDSVSPFTHLGPVAASFHPLMAEMADAERLRRLPIFLVHGKLDWMFPVQVARRTHAALSAAGANVTYREIDDLSHSYPREINAEMLWWLNADKPKPVARG